MRSAASRTADRGGAAVVVRRADARGVEHLLHPLLVAKRDGLFDGHARNAECFADSRRQHHGRLPQRRDMIDVDAGGALHHLVHDRILVGE